MEKKYIPLSDFFQNLKVNEITLTFKEIENIIGQQLPNAAHLNSSWWKKTKSPFTHYQAWISAGYHVKTVMIGNKVTFTNSTNQNIESSMKKQSIIVREAELIDSKNLISLKKSIYTNNPYEYYELSQYDMSVQAMKKYITHLKRSNSGVIFISIFNGQVVMIEANKIPHSKLEHIAQLHIWIKPKWDVNEIGSSLLNAILNWTSNNNVSKLETKAAPENEEFVALFQNFDFLIEGIRKNAIVIGNDYMSELYLGKIIEQT